MKNYIEYYFDENGRFSADIHKKGRCRVVKNEKNLYKLLEISQKHGYNVNREGIIRKRAKQITKEFDKYMKRKQRLKIIGNIFSNMKVSRKNAALGKIVVTASLFAVIATNGLGAKKSEPISATEANASTSIVYMQETNIDETIDRLDETPEAEIIEEKVVEVQLQEEKQEETKKEQLNSMFQEESFHFTYEDRSNNESINKAKRYEDIFEKYANRYGLDKDLLMAMAAQESSGEHYDNLGDRKPAAGIMQIEKAIHIGEEVKAYNFETNQMETVKVTKEKLHDIESNIQIGSMILRGYIENNNYNIPLAVQTYNMGPGNMSKVLNTCGDLENIEVSEMRNNPTNNEWLNYRAFLKVGDSKYVEHVFSYLGKDKNVEVLKRNNEKISVNLVNDGLQMTKM